MDYPTSGAYPLKFIQENKMMSWQWLGFAVIAFFVFLVYFPSLMHVPRADQIMYLGEVADQHSFLELAINDYDLNRHRTIAPGDELLFRPIVYFMLGAERFFFGYQFLWWQLIGIMLHLGVTWFMLRLLLTINCGLPAVLATGYFALLFGNMEMVIWHHINSYMVFVICLLIALRYFYEVLVKEEILSDRIVPMSIALLIACFTYEPANIYALLMAVILWVKRPLDRRVIFFLILPVIFYVGASWANMHLNHYHETEGHFMVKLFHPIISLKNVLASMIFWLYFGLFPSQQVMVLAARNMVSDGAWLVNPLNLKDANVIVMLVMLIMLTVALCFNRVKEIFYRHRIFMLMLLTMSVIYTAVIVVGRGNSRGIKDILRVDLYYNYIFWALLIVLIFVLFSTLRLLRWQKIVISACLVAVIFTNSFLLYKANDYQARGNNEILVFINTLSLLVQAKGNEKDFSFFADDHYPGNYIYKEYRRFDEPPERMYSLAEILFPRYFNRQSAKYKFLTSDK